MPKQVKKLSDFNLSRVESGDLVVNSKKEYFLVQNDGSLRKVNVKAVNGVLYPTGFAGKEKSNGA